MFILFVQKSNCTTGSESNDRGTQAFTKIIDSLSENQEHGNGDQVRGGLSCISQMVPCGGNSHPCPSVCGQCPAVCGRAVLAIFLPYHCTARAPAGTGPLQGVPTTVLGL